MSLIQLVEKIKERSPKSNLILILEKPKLELENILLAKGSVIIFYHNQIKIKDIINLMTHKEEKEELEKEIQDLKQILKQSQTQQEEKIEDSKDVLLSKEDVEKIEQEIQREYQEKKIAYHIIKRIKRGNKKETKEGKIVSVAGISGNGKSIFTVNLSQIMQEDKRKILIMDLDILNNSISILLQKIKNKKMKIEKVAEEMTPYFTENTTHTLPQIIQKVTNKIDIIKAEDLFLIQRKIGEEKIKDVLENLKKQYDLILIDTSNECFYDSTKEMLRQSNKIIFITEANVLQIRKSKKMLEIYEKEWGMKKEKITMIFNKNKEDSLEFNILKELFQGYDILGKVDFIKQYNTLINQNMNTLFIEKNIKKQYLKIGRNLLKNPKSNIYYLNKIEMGEKENGSTQY